MGITTIQNNLLKIGVKTTGAELCQIASAKHGTEFMWNADPDIWPNYAPNLFPIVGMLKNETYFFDGGKYTLPKHGFIRNNSDFEILEESSDRITLRLLYSEKTLAAYPFKFEYFVIYHLEDNKLHINYTVKNCDGQTIYFSVGGHPAFKCPVYNDEKYSDYELIFDQQETSQTHLLNLNTGLVTSQTEAILDSPTTIKMRYDLFNKDALIFKDLKSRKVTLNGKKSDILTVHFEDFPYLGLWAKPNANYVCIEPWLGIADHEDTNQQLKTKEGILKLEAGKSFSATYTIEIHLPHLV